MNRPLQGVLIATGTAFLFAIIPVGCGSGGNSGAAPATISPETEKATQDMLKNKSQQYNERYKNKGKK